MPVKEVCPHCGAKMVRYPHGLTRLLVRILKVCWNKSKLGKIPFRVSSNSAFNYSEASNFQKLRYWGLVEKLDSKPKGAWIFTDKARQFIAGEISLPKNIWTYRGEPVATEDSVKNIFIYEIDPSWPVRTREDYAKEAKSFTRGESTTCPK